MIHDSLHTFYYMQCKREKNMQQLNKTRIFCFPICNVCYKTKKKNWHSLATKSNTVSETSKTKKNRIKFIVFDLK